MRVVVRQHPARRRHLTHELSTLAMIVRLAISGLAWALCYPALLFYLSAVGGIAMVAADTGPFPRVASPSASLGYLECSLPFGVIAWLLLGAMNMAWIWEKRIGKTIPVVATICAVVGAIPFGPLSLFALPGALFAAYLCWWHSSKVSDGLSA
mgnify:CR=1 FL=1